MSRPVRLALIEGGRADATASGGSRGFVPVELPPDESAWDRSLLIGLLLALALNSAMASYFLRPPKPPEEDADTTIEFALVEPPPPPPEPEPEPEPEPPVVDLSQPPLPTDTAPEEEPPKEPPKSVFGLSMSSTVDAGSGAFAARVGNTLMKEPEAEVTPADEVQALPRVSFHRLDEPPRLVRDYRAEYPLAAKEGGFQGTVIMKLCIDNTGQVTDVRVVRGVHDELDAAAKAAAFRFVFKPGRSGGQPVITTNFVYRYTWIIED